MSSYTNIIFQEKKGKIKSLMQTITLNKARDQNKLNAIENQNLNNKNINDDIKEILDISFKINKLSYYNIKKKSKIYFNKGKLYIKPNEDGNNFINLIFYDTSLMLRFQGFADIKKSSFIIDTTYENCAKVKEIIGLVYYIDEKGNNKYDIIVTNIYIFFQSKNDLYKFFKILN